jgi:hypothetical protein
MVQALAMIIGAIVVSFAYRVYRKRAILNRKLRLEGYWPRRLI